MKLINTHIDAPVYMDEEYFNLITQNIENKPFGDKFWDSADEYDGLSYYIDRLLLWVDDPIDPEYWSDIFYEGITSLEQYIEFIRIFGFVIGPVRDIEDMM